MSNPKLPELPEHLAMNDFLKEMAAADEFDKANLAYRPAFVALVDTQPSHERCCAVSAPTKPHP